MSSTSGSVEKQSIRKRLVTFVAIAAMAISTIFGFAAPASADRNVDREFIPPTVYWWRICGDDDGDDDGDPRDTDDPVDVREQPDNEEFCAAGPPTGGDTDRNPGRS